MRRPTTACVALLLGVGPALGACGGADQAATTTRPYVALGDSFTAAPLVPEAYDADGCYRSHANYPALIAAARPDLTLTDVSCSGAETRDLIGSQTTGDTTHPPQLDALTADTALVTIGIGGNDEDISHDLIRTCVELAATDPAGAPCREADATSADPIADRIARVEGTVGAALAAIADRAPRARVVVVGYPQLVPATGTCPDLLPLAAGDHAWVRAQNRRLSDALRAAAGTAGVAYVDAWSASAGHDICADDPWINGRTTDEGAALAYHPFAPYERAVADLLLELL